MSGTVPGRAPPPSFGAWEAGDGAPTAPLSPASQAGPWGCAGTHDDHPADVAAAQLRVGRVVHVGHPAAHEDAQPHHQQVLHLDPREAALQGKGNAFETLSEGQGFAQGSGSWPRMASATQRWGNLQPFLYIFISLLCNSCCK